MGKRTRLSCASARRGFTLIEVILTMAILSILITLISTGYPVVRDNQALQLAQQQLEFLVREAQQRALNEERDETCLDSAEEARRCSDVGLAFNGSAITLFADTTGEDLAYTVGDYVIATHQSPAQLTGIDSILFVAQPPNITLLANGLQPLSGQASLRAQVGEQEVQLNIKNYGQVERQ